MEDDDQPDLVHVQLLRDGTWHAVWGGRELLGEFDGTRDEAIAWARERCPRIRIFSKDVGAFVPLDDDAT